MTETVSRLVMREDKPSIEYYWKTSDRGIVQRLSVILNKSKSFKWRIRLMVRISRFQREEKSSILLRGTIYEYK